MSREGRLSTRKSRSNNRERPGPSKNPGRVVVLVCEGKKTEPSYFEGLRKQLGRNEKFIIKIEKIGAGGVKVYEQACGMWSKYKIDKTKDFVWAVFDVDDIREQSLSEIENKSKRNSIKLAISNPCFEIWLLWHFQNHSSFSECRELHKIICDFYPNYGKLIDYSILENQQAEAIRRAKESEIYHAENQSNGNPSSSVWRLLESILPKEPV